MRYCKTQDRILLALHLMKEGDLTASAQILSDAVDGEEFEEDFLYLNSLQTASFHGEEPEGDDSGPQIEAEVEKAVASEEADEGWDDILADDEEAEEETQAETASSLQARRTKMMVRNLKALREGRA